jgi:hypothetical protein
MPLRSFRRFSLGRRDEAGAGPDYSGMKKTAAEAAEGIPQAGSIGGSFQDRENPGRRKLAIRVG